MINQNSFQRRVRADEFVEEWRAAFKGVRDVFIADGWPTPRQIARRYPNDALWVTIEKPCPGIHLLAVEMPTKDLPLMMRLRIWVYKESRSLYRRLRNAPPMVIRGESHTATADVAPDPSFRAELAESGFEVIGLIFEVRDLSFLADEEVIHSALHTIGQQFCGWVLEHARDPVMALEESADADDDEEIAFVEGAEEAQQEIAEDPRFSHTDAKTRRALVNARIGQGGYRRRMLRLWHGRCAVTDADITEVLVASHAMPWTAGSIDDCLNPYNGLLLSANIDRLFDRGLISFGNDGVILKKDAITWVRLGQLGVTPESRMRMVDDRHRPYLAAHRQRFGFPV